jgi:hypothetical protein
VRDNPLAFSIKARENDRRFERRRVDAPISTQPQASRPKRRRDLETKKGIAGRSGGAAEEKLFAVTTSLATNVSSPPCDGRRALYRAG